MKNIYFVLIFIFITSCQNNKLKEVEVFLDGFQETEVVLESVVTFDDMISMPMQLFVIDSVLLVNEFRNSGFLLSLWGVKTGTLIGRDMKVGRGPNEFIAPLKIHSHKRKISILDRMNKWYSEYILNEKLALEQVLKIDDLEGSPVSLQGLGDGTFLGAQLNDEEDMFYVYDLDGSIISSFGEYPKLEGTEGLSNFLIRFIYQGFSFTNLDQEKLAFGAMMTGTFMFFDLKDKAVTQNHIVSESIEFRDLTDTEQKSLTVSYDHPQGAAFGASDADHVYYYYTGDYNDKGEMNITILQFGWDGQKEKAFRIKEDLRAFTVHEGKLYGLDETGEQLYTYSID